MKPKIFKIMMPGIAMILVAALEIPLRSFAQENRVTHTRYKLIELGTFGGPNSYINPVGNGGPYMNHEGMIVGSATTSITIPPDQNGFPCPFPPNEVFHSMKWGDGGVSDLDSLGDASNCSNALAINDDGLAVGTSENGKLDPATGVQQLRAVFWKDGKIENLGTLGGNHSFATSINNRGQIVGFALNKVPDPFSLFDFRIGGSGNGTQTRAFLWEKGRMQDLHTLGGPDAWATFVNERGEIAGYSYTNSTPNPTGFPTQDPFLWTKEAGMTDLGSLGGTVGFPGGLNNRGQVIGQSNLAGDQIADPFLWDGQKMIDMFTAGIGGNFQVANAINDAGEVVGGAAFPNRLSDAALWRNGVITDLGTLPGDCFSQAFALNSRGQVVGGSASCDGNTIRAFLWEHGEIVDLNILIAPNSGFLLVETNAINDRGEIAGNALPPGCTPADFSTCSQAYVLIPCDGQHSDEKGCGDKGEASTAAIQNNPAPANQRPTSAMEAGMTAREIEARMRARFARLFRLSPQK